jgi:uncharacterized protein DUF5916/cellulose/xylan binding protein with CBM9 domain
MKTALLVSTIALACSLNAFAQTAPETSKLQVEKPLKGGSSKSAVAPPEKAQPIRIPFFKNPPVIDGRLDDESWKAAAILKDFYQIQPGDNIPPSKSTEVLLGYDSRFLYLAFRASDEPGKVRATVAKRDAIFDDDTVGVYLDTFNDQRRAYYCFFNPLGVQADGIYTEGSGVDLSVDLVMESRGVIADDGYIIEIAIPFKSMRYRAGKDMLWGIHFYRTIKRFNNEQDSWMPISRDKSGLLNQEGHVTGIEGTLANRSLEIIPTLALSETGKRVRTINASALAINPTLNDPGRFVNQPVGFDPGLTVKLGITSTVTLDLTVNPDFAEVEADQPVIIANQRFPIFFEEKRPFFLEGIDIFQTPLTAVHTRAIINPDYAMKLTGKYKRDTFGLLFASDAGPGNFSEEELSDPQIFPTIERFIDKKAYIGILRWKRDIGKESNLGLIATSYNFIEQHNQLGGLDGRFRLDPQTVFSFQALGAASRRFFFEPVLAEDIYRTGNGFAYNFTYDKSKRLFGYVLGGEGRTRDYRADVGFTLRANTNNEYFFIRYNTDPKPKARLVSWTASNFVAMNFDWQGRSQYEVVEPKIILNFQRQTVLGIGLTGRYERLLEEEFGAKRTATHPGAFFGDPERSAYRKEIFGFASSNPTKEYSFGFFGVYRWGEFDFDFGAGPKFPRVSPAALADPSAPLDPGPGRSLNINAYFNYQPIDTLRASLTYIKSRLVRNDTSLVAFDDNIYSLRVTYQFTRFIFIRARADYSTLESRVRTQLLLGYTPNPGTSFYIGYNDDLNRNGFSPFTGQFEPGFHRNSRTFFIKMSYLIRRNL